MMADKCTKSRKLRIALIGYGKMGRAVETVALARGHELVARADSKKGWEEVSLADICIEFSHPEAAAANIERLTAMGKSAVVGTTGWYEKLPDIKKIVEAKGTALLYAPNFSLGVALYMELVAKAVQLMARYPEFAPGGFEEHHSAKADAPSGTAKAMGELLLAAYPEKKGLAGSGAADNDWISFPSLRCGEIPGTHTLLFDGPHETITLTHRSRSRSHFAEGALIAAEWLVGKQGLFTFEQMIKQQGAHS